MNKEFELLIQIESGEVAIDELSNPDQIIMVGMAFSRPDLLPSSKTQKQLLDGLPKSKKEAIDEFLERPLILTNKILAHNINQPFSDEIKEGLPLKSCTPLPFGKDLIKFANEDAAIITLKQQFNVSNYLCCQIQLLNLLARHYGFIGTYKHPFLQLNTGSVSDKIKGNPFSKHESTAFNGEVLKGLDHDHIELFAFNTKYGRASLYKNYEFENLKANKLDDTKIRVDSFNDPLQQLVAAPIEASKMAYDLMAETDENVCKKNPTDRGKVTGPWLISEADGEGKRRYLCITPHGNPKYPDTVIKEIIDRAKSFY
ncbi:hypothetical protein AN214_02804 [Pseudoalteromonas sp. P1-9]|uniref:hypothetical protein n=1 Tax=Pseudoalteromonas sp. P1-9 TaxID=1710354 RepID=UPI0006D63FC2|nr:hypothetical protein [Pseudoalteromonas sp. P1-9]KPV95152.1 hypothetical protein AN214_02804 [Pseudoalteromonas sp. P1-9]